MILVGVGGSMGGYTEAHGSVHGMYSWKLQLMEAIMEASTSTDSGNFHVLPWKLPLTSVDVNLLPPTSMEISIEVNLLLPTSVEVNLLQWKFPCKLAETSVEIDRAEVVGPLRKSCASRWKLVILGGRWKNVGVYGSSCQLPHHIFGEAAIDGSIGS